MSLEPSEPDQDRKTSLRAHPPPPISLRRRLGYFPVSPLHICRSLPDSFYLVNLQDSAAAVIVAAYKTGDHAAAIEWVDRLRCAGLSVSRNGYTAAVNACCALGNLEAAAGVLGVMSEARVVPSASLYNAVLETICPPSEGGYSARVRWRNGDGDGGGGLGGDGVAASAEGVEGVESDNGHGSRRSSSSSREGDCASGGSAGAGSVVVGKGVRKGRGEEEPPESKEGARDDDADDDHHDRPRRAAEKADSALSLFEEMWRREVPMNGVTYAMVISALLGAERKDEVLSLWTQVRITPHGQQ